MALAKPVAGGGGEHDLREAWKFLTAAREMFPATATSGYLILRHPHWAPLHIDAEKMAADSHGLAASEVIVHGKAN